MPEMMSEPTLLILIFPSRLYTRQLVTAGEEEKKERRFLWSTDNIEEWEGTDTGTGTDGSPESIWRLHGSG
jgi:hypothetical protein